MNYFHPFKIQKNLLNHKINFSPKGNNSVRTFSITEFEKEFNFNYTPQLIVEDQKIYLRAKKKCSQLLERLFFQKKLRWLGTYYRKPLDECQIIDMEIKWINNLIEYGAFATHKIKKSEYIGEYTGILSKKKFFNYNLSANNYTFSYITSIISPRQFYIDSKNYGNETRFINHSDCPNCESASLLYDGIIRVIIYAIINIYPGTQLTMDYGPGYWKHRNKVFNH